MSPNQLSTPLASHSTDERTPLRVRLMNDSLGVGAEAGSAAIWALAGLLPAGVASVVCAYATQGRQAHSSSKRAGGAGRFNSVAGRVFIQSFEVA